MTNAEMLADTEARLAVTPADPQALYEKAAALIALGRSAEGVSVADLALCVAPDNPHVWVMRAAGLIACGRLLEALVACDKALLLDPQNHEAMLNKGAALVHLRRHHDAIDCLNQALESDPTNTNLLANRAAAHHNLGMHEECIADYRALLKINPGFTTTHSSLIACLDFLHTDGFDLLQHERAEFQRVHAGHLPWKTHPKGKARRRPLRIGYVSGDLHYHSAAFAVVGMINHHPRDQFHVTMYDNDRIQKDAMTQAFRRRADEWRFVVGLNDEQLADLIYQDKIDILVDLSGHSTANRLLAFARKPAPIQINAWGHSGGTGLKAMDYTFADPICIPAEVRHMFAEKVWDLPCIITYTVPTPMPDIPPPHFKRAGNILFGCLNRYSKVTPETEEVWANILRLAPTAELLLKDSYFEDEDHRQLVFDRFQSMGVDGARLIFMGSTPHYDHIQSYGEVDICLDPFPMGGGVTTWESLWMGTPVICKRGKTLPGLIAAGISHAVGLEGCVAQDNEEYTRIALTMAAEQNWGNLEEIRTTMRDRLMASDAGNVDRYASVVEEAYRTMWREYCSRSTTR